jgi:ubiquinone/menaquinone biosynthesis C-methylase UbiE
VRGVDIDREAIASARRSFVRPNLGFAVADGLALPFGDAAFDVVLCAHVYEHVPDPRRLLTEIRRVLKPGGVCYFAAGNRFQPMEPHYRLPLLSVVPKFLAHLYLRVLGRGRHYYETHLSYWQLRRLVSGFVVDDCTARMIEAPGRYAMEYLLPPGSLKAALARAFVRFAYPFVPTYIWLLRR